jgi:putative transcriptional regulator
MKDELFNELAASVREGGAILRGDAEPSRTFVVDGPNIKRLRASYKLSQEKFAALFGISVGTLRNWEQGRRTPEGPARVLLEVAVKHPEAVADVARSAPRQIRRVAKAQRSVKPVTHVTAKGRRSPATPATRSRKETRYGPDKSHP